MLPCTPASPDVFAFALMFPPPLYLPELHLLGSYPLREASPGAASV